MKNIDILKQNIEDGLNFIEKQQNEVRPIITYLTKIMKENIDDGSLTAKEAFNMYIKLMELDTNSVLIISKMKEILTYSDNDW